MDLTMDKIVDPWNKDVKITPSPSLIQLFQDWNQTKSSVKKLCSFNRAKQWIALLLKRPVEIPNGHKMRLVDHLAAIDHMATAHQSGISHDDYLRSCLAPIAPIQTEAKFVADRIAKVDTNVKIVIIDVDKTEESAQVPEEIQSSIEGNAVGINSAKAADETKVDTNVKVVIKDAVDNADEPALVHEGAQSPIEGIKSPNEGNAYQPVCGSVWKGVACETTNCPKVHKSRCEDPNCLILDQGLPRYKIIQCNNWHSKPRSKKKKSKKCDIPVSRTSYPRVKKPAPRQVDQWPPLPQRRGPATSKKIYGSSQQAINPVHTVTYHNRAPWPKTRDPFPKHISTTNHLGNESAARSTPSLGGNQTTWEAMIRSDPSQKLNLALELFKMISQM